MRHLWRFQSTGHHARPSLKKPVCNACGRAHSGWYDKRLRRVRDLSCGDTRIYLEIEIRRVLCCNCGKVKRERLDFLAKNPLYTKRFAWYVGRRCRSSTVSDIACKLNPDWHTVKELDKQYMTTQLERAGTPAPKAIGIDEISIRKRHTYRIVVSDLSDTVRSGLAVQIARRTACGSSMTGWERSSPKAFACGDGHVETLSQRR